MNELQFIETAIEDGIGFVTLNRPKQLNALNRQMISEIVSVIESFDRNPQVKVMLLYWKGKSIFCWSRY